MAFNYQRVSRPRFFVDIMSYLHAIGYSKPFEIHNSDNLLAGSKTDLLYSNTQNKIEFEYESGSKTPFNFIDSNKFPSKIPIDCVVALNHNFKGLKLNFNANEGTTEQWSINNPILNGEEIIEFNGCTIMKNTNDNFITQDTTNLYLNVESDSTESGTFYCGSFFFGKTYTPPHNPNLSMTMNNTFDGIKKTKTKGGHTISNVDFIGNPLWSEHNAWELWIEEDRKQNMGRLGRKSWNLNFDFISETDMFGFLEQSNTNPFSPTETVPQEERDGTFGSYDNPFLEADNFISRVWIPTLGGSIPMIMQVDDTNNNPDQFTIVTIKQNTFSVRPKAPNLYSVAMTLEETW